MREHRLAAAVLFAALAAAWPAAATAGERMVSETNDLARSAVGGAGGTSGSATGNNRLDAAFGEEVGGSSVATSANRLAPGFVQNFSFPGTVTGLTALDDVTVSSVTLQWTAPGLDGFRGSLAHGSSYYIRVASHQVAGTFTNFSSATIVFSTAGTSPGATVSTVAVGLQPNTTYWWRLWAKDPAGGLSYASEISTFVTLALPVSLQSESFVLVSFTSVTAQWVPRPSLLQDVSSMSAAGYRLEASSTNFGALQPGGVISSSETANVTLSTLTVSDPGLVVDRTYYLRAGSLNWEGRANWTVLGTTDTKFQVNVPLPGDPPYLDLSTGSLTASWERNGNPANARYDADASNTFDFTGEVTSTGTYNLFYSSAGLSANTTYYFRVYATTRATSSAYASLASTMTWAFAPAEAAAPFAGVFESSLTVRWLHNGNLVGVSSYSVVATTSPVYPNADDGNRVLLSTVPRGADPMATVSSLEPNTTYFLFGAGVNWVGAQGEFVLIGSTATRPVPPSTVVYDEVSFSSAVAGWVITGNPLGVTTYTVTMSTVSGLPRGGAWDVTLSTVPDSSPVLIEMTGLQLNATYQLSVTAVGHAHAAFVVGETSATMAAIPGVSPDVLDYDPVTTTAFTLNWSSGTADPGYDAPAQWTTYYADISVNPSFSPVLASSRTFNLSAPFTGLSLNTTYYARVAAFSHHHGALTDYADFTSTATRAAVPVTVATTFNEVSFTSATVSWGRNGNPVSVTTYTVVFSSGYVYPNELPDNIVFDTAPAGGVLSAAVEGLASNTTYTFFVRAINHKGAETSWVNFGSTRTLFSPKTWTGATNGLWNTATNWSPNGVPTRTDAVTIAIAANVSAIGSQIAFSSLTLGSPANPVVALTVSTTISNGGSVLIYKNSGLTQSTTRQLVFDGDFTMVSGSSLSHTSENATFISSVNIRVTGTFDLQAGATINVMGRGYRGGPVDTAGFGPGAGGTDTANNEGGGGAAYGGTGGNGVGAPGGAGSATTYGSATAPINMGSGGGGSGNTGVGGAGGGIVIIDAGTMALDGVIISSGAQGQPVPTGTIAAGGGGGSGGGVFITAGTFSGTGSIDVQGGRGGTDDVGPGGGGGGGRAAVVVTGSGVTCGVSILIAGGASGGGASGAGVAGSSHTADSLGAAQGLTGTAQSATSIAWTWSLTTGATDYQVFSSTGGPMSPPLAGAGNYTTTGLAVNTTASFYVQARACGANVADSAPADAATLAQVPTATAASFPQVNLSSMSVSWTANSNPVNVTSYTVVLSPQAVFPNADPGNVFLSTLPAGTALEATMYPLDPNTTYYLFVAAMNHASILTSYVDLSAAAATRPLPLGLQDESFVTVDLASAAAQWVAHPSLAQDVSSMSAGGYVVEASSTNFGSLTPGGAIYSSATWNVLLSTLTVDIVPAPANLCETHYFRAAALNWAGLRSAYTALGSTRTAEYGVVVAIMNLNLGSIDVNTEQVIAQSLPLENVGCPVTYHVKATTVTPGSLWTISTTSGTETFTLQAMFNSAEPALTAFEDVDKLTDATAPASATVFAGDQRGDSVPLTQDRLLWFKLGMPRSVSTTEDQDIRITVYALPP
ncbi:MAG: fibronectin type III domain-containing protein [Elusimicrobiota bacterium]|nr:fibronectin type III domain-containing protein [Elusimicrobiota bacterium]